MFAATLFVCAFLLFWLEPLFSQAALLLVWTAASTGPEGEVTDPARRTTPLTCHGREGPAGRALRADGWGVPADPASGPLLRDHHASLLEVLRW